MSRICAFPSTAVLRARAFVREDDGVIVFAMPAAAGAAAR